MTHVPYTFGISDFPGLDQHKATVTVDDAKATIQITDHGLVSGVYHVSIAITPKPVSLAEHIARHCHAKVLVCRDVDRCTVQSWIQEALDEYNGGPLSDSEIVWEENYGCRTT